MQILAKIEEKLSQNRYKHGSSKSFEPLISFLGPVEVE